MKVILTAIDRWIEIKNKTKKKSAIKCALLQKSYKIKLLYLLDESVWCIKEIRDRQSNSFSYDDDDDDGSDYDKNIVNPLNNNIVVIAFVDFVPHITHNLLQIEFSVTQWHSFVFKITRRNYLTLMQSSLKKLKFFDTKMKI